jgi:hypothetical protein
VATSTLRIETLSPKQIVARRGSRALTTELHALPWGQQAIVRVAHDHKVRVALLALLVQGQLHEAMAGATDRTLALGHLMVARGQQDHALRLMAVVVSVPGGRKVAMVGQLAAMLAEMATGIGPVHDVAVGTSQRFRK